MNRKPIVKSAQVTSPYHGPIGLWKRPLLLALEEDHSTWDWTTRGALFERPESRVSARIVMKGETGIWAASGLVQALSQVSFEQDGEAIEARSAFRDGDRLTKGDVVAAWEGSASSVLRFERGFLNLASYVGGIATQTRAMVDAVEAKWKSLGREARGPAPRVTSTRKILPGFRDLAIHGVIAGGGFSHRVDLSGGVLIKENHIAAAGGIPQAVSGARKAAPHGLRLEVEVRSLKELGIALGERVDGVLLDNFSPRQVQKAVSLIRDSKSRSTFVEVSGGLGAANVARYVMPGVHVLSSGSLTHSVTALDLSLLIDWS